MVGFDPVSLSTVQYGCGSLYNMIRMLNKKAGPVPDEVFQFLQTLNFLDFNINIEVVGVATEQYTNFNSIQHAWLDA